ncbi:hypothetical protein F2Q69_00036226 [Brassica cretica]|uniref:Uncharacterized protein n=1 Tax=Brassica cretica TaxID=69181 RepID=A0A8S9SH91_BRACR|nr:hypothetical protein F2Q69_00036226 [Brassica cretica]
MKIDSANFGSHTGPSESMDSSASSLDLTAEVENPSHAVTSVASLSPETYRFLSMGPVTSIGVEEVASWRVKYYLPDDVAIRVPGPIDRVSDFEADETSEAEYRCLPSPSFEGEPVIPSKTAIEKTPEPTADDPPSDP